VLADHHPSFANPTIAEALCEIHFLANPEHPWVTSRPFPLYKRIEAEFPGMELVPETTIRLEL